MLTFKIEHDNKLNICKVVFKSYKLIFTLFIFLGFASCMQQEKSIVKITGKRIAVDTTITKDLQIDSFISPYRDQLIQDMNEPLSFAPIDFVANDGNLQSTLGNLIADLCFEMANPVFNKLTNESIDFVMMNSGGLRAPIPKGVVTKENAFLVMPFENQLVVAELTSEKIKELFDYFVRRKRAHPLSKQVNLTITNNGYTVTINGKALEDGKTYRVLTNDYLQTGGDGMTFFANPKQLTDLDYALRDAIIDYFKKVNPLEAHLDQRISIVE